MNHNEEVRLPSLGLALIPIIISVAIFIVGIGILKYPAEIMLVFSGIVFSLFAMINGHKWDTIITVMGSKIKKALPAILILLSIGLLIGSWIISGTIPYFIYYGLKMIDPNYLYLMAFIVTAIVSTCTGTSWGAAGTVGVALMGIARTMDLSLAITAGAVVSGSYFGDKLSPLSDTTNMSSLAAEANIYEHIKHMLFTAIPSSIVAMIVFFSVGLGISTNTTNLKHVQDMLSTMDQLFNLNILLLIPPVIVLVGSIMKKSPLIVLFISSLAAMILALCFQHVSLSNLFTATVEGFNVDILKETIPSLDSSIITDDVASLLNRGGLYSMYNSTAFIFYAFFFASALEVSGSLKVVLQHIIKYLRSTGSIIFATLVTGFATICCTSNALVTFFLVKDIYGDIFKKKGLHPVNLSRSMEDSVTITEVLMPWTVSGVFIASTLGVDNFTFLPWAIFNLGGFVFSALYGFLAPLTRGFGIRQLEKREGSNSTDPGQTPTV